MVDFNVNPKDSTQRYLEALNTVFSDWGDMSTFRWCFERDCGAGLADLLVATDGGSWLGGSAVTYRLVKDSLGTVHTVGLMTGSWTLPAARGQGLFTQMIKQSRALVKERGGSYLLAFVTADNPSRRRLETAGACMLPTHYLFSGESTPGTELDHQWKIMKDQTVHGDVFREVVASRNGGAHISYSTESAFTGQFLRRPGKITLLKEADTGALAVLEYVNGTQRLQAFASGGPPGPSIQGLLSYAQARGDTFFCFSHEQEIADIATQLQMNEKAGYMTLIPATGAELDEVPLGMRKWRMDSGDRM